MSGKHSELEGRLDDLLSRIAMETQEIKELEQQLTDGQILANEALQRDLEEVICGLREYLGRLRQQALLSKQQVVSLQAENQSLQLHLEDAQRHCRQLEDSARTHTQNMSVQQGELSLLQKEAQTLRERQVESSRQQAELEAELHLLREELSRQVTLGQFQVEALQAAADKEKQTREIRESQLQSTIESLQVRFLVRSGFLDSSASSRTLIEGFVHQETKIPVNCMASQPVEKLRDQEKEDRFCRRITALMVR